MHRVIYSNIAYKSTTIMAASQSNQAKETNDKSTDGGAGAASANGGKATEKKVEHLGALEEDDEFEVRTRDQPSLYMRLPISARQMV